LLNSSLSSIPTYFLSVFAPKKWFIKRVNKIRRGFLWKGSEDANGGHCLVNWKKVQRPKKLGGLGVLDLELFSRALRQRWLWLQWTDPGRPWSSLTCLVMKWIISFSGLQQRYCWAMVGKRSSGSQPGWTAWHREMLRRGYISLLGGRS
jgi:hypothetical protein